MPSSPTSLLIAAVAPDPTNITTSSGLRADRAVNHAARLLAQPAHQAPGRRDRGVGVGVVGPNLREPRFDEMHEAPGRGEIGVKEHAASERREQRCAATHLLLSDESG